MRVLIADDEPGVRASVAAALRDAHHQVYEAVDGLAALESICEERPDLLVLDLHMPRMNGLEVLKWLRRHHEARPIPVIILSGFVATLDQFDECPFVIQVLQKPFHIQHLLETARVAEMALAPA